MTLVSAPIFQSDGRDLLQASVHYGGMMVFVYMCIKMDDLQNLSAICTSFEWEWHQSCVHLVKSLIEKVFIKGTEELQVCAWHCYQH